jgi:hypothetical protein
MSSSEPMRIIGAGVERNAFQFARRGASGKLIQLV